MKNTTEIETLYSVGHGLRGGYMPESAPVLCIGPTDARETLLAELDYLGDFLADGCHLGDGYEDIERENEEALAELGESITELKAGDVSQGWSVYSGHSSYWIEPITRGDVDIPADLSGVALAEMVENLNEDTW